MRLTLVKSSLPLVLVATMVCSQQSKPSSTSQTGQPIAVKNSGTRDCPCEGRAQNPDTSSSREA